MFSVFSFEDLENYFCHCYSRPICCERSQFQHSARHNLHSLAKSERSRPKIVSVILFQRGCTFLPWLGGRLIFEILRPLETGVLIDVVPSCGSL